MTKDTELLPCPFCGGEAGPEPSSEIEPLVYYGCSSCEVWRLGQKWNRRAAPPAVRGSAGDVQAAAGYLELMDGQIGPGIRDLRVRGTLKEYPAGTRFYAEGESRALAAKPPEAPAEARRPQDDEAFDAEDQDAP